MKKRKKNMYSIYLTVLSTMRIRGLRGRLAFVPGFCRRTSIDIHSGVPTFPQFSIHVVRQGPLVEKLLDLCFLLEE